MYFGLLAYGLDLLKNKPFVLLDSSIYYLTKLGEKLRSSSAPEFTIFVCKYRVLFLVATPTGLVTNLVLD